jgi:hypothetical protein
LRTREKTQRLVLEWVHDRPEVRTLQTSPQTALLGLGETEKKEAAAALKLRPDKVAAAIEALQARAAELQPQLPVAATERVPQRVLYEETETEPKLPLSVVISVFQGLTQRYSYTAHGDENGWSQALEDLEALIHRIGGVFEGLAKRVEDSELRDQLGAVAAKFLEERPAVEGQPAAVRARTMNLASEVWSSSHRLSIDAGSSRTPVPAREVLLALADVGSHLYAKAFSGRKAGFQRGWDVLHAAAGIASGLREVAPVLSDGQRSEVLSIATQLEGFAGPTAILTKRLQEQGDQLQRHLTELMQRLTQVAEGIVTSPSDEG